MERQDPVVKGRESSFDGVNGLVFVSLRGGRSSRSKHNHGTNQSPKTF